MERRAFGCRKGRRGRNKVSGTPVILSRLVDGEPKAEIQERGSAVGRQTLSPRPRLGAQKPSPLSLCSGMVMGLDPARLCCAGHLSHPRIWASSLLVLGLEPAPDFVL